MFFPFSKGQIISERKCGTEKISHISALASKK
jgi:hypothetical protein